MVSSFYTPPQISNDEAFPLRNIVGDLLKQYQQQQENQARGINLKYQEPNLIEALKMNQQKNKYYGPNMESQIGLRGAQAGHLGAQTRGLDIENKFKPRALESQMANAMLKQQILNQIMNGVSPQQAGNQDMNGVPPVMQGQPQGMPQQGQQGQGMNYPQSAIAMQMLGLGKPKVENIGGKYTALSPFGNNVVAEGPTPLQEQLTKSDAKQIANLENTVISSSAKQDALNSMGEIISSPEFEALRRNPILGKHELAWYGKFGTPEQQEMVGNFKATAGDIIKSSARDFGGQFRVGEQALLNGMKPTDSDSLNVMKGKTEALMFMVDAMAERAKLEATAMREMGMSPIAARLYSDKIFDSKAMKRDIKDMLRSPSSMKGMPTPDEAKAELARRGIQ